MRSYSLRESSLSRRLFLGRTSFLIFRRAWWLYLLCLYLAACNTTSTPTQSPATPSPTTSDPGAVVAAFLNAWERGAYDEMYAWLSPLSQDAISREEFQQHYVNVANVTGAITIETQLLSVLKSGLTAQARYRVTWHTALVGTLRRDIDMPLVYIADRWLIAWSDGLIMPELANGNALHMEYLVPARANIYDRS